MHTRGMGLFISLCVMIVVLAGCATTPGALPSGKTEAGEGTGATAGEQTVQSADCPVTTPITITPPGSKYRDPLPRGAYYASADEMILVPTEEWGLGGRKIHFGSSRSDRGLPCRDDVWTATPRRSGPTFLPGILAIFSRAP